MDEPTFAQDRRNTERMMEAVLTATAPGADKLGSTIVLVTHDMKLVADYATRVVAMHEGRVALDGLPKQLFADRALLEKVNLEEPALFRIVRELREAGSPASRDIVSAGDFVASVSAAGLTSVPS
jgi:energy-coupling factor transport system ATP-binding protein